MEIALATGYQNESKYQKLNKKWRVKLFAVNTTRINIFTNQYFLKTHTENVYFLEVYLQSLIVDQKQALNSECVY